LVQKSYDKIIYGGFELFSSEISNDNNLNDLVNKVDDVNQVLSLLSGEEIELANKIYDKAENLKTTLNNLDELVKSDSSSFFENIVGLNASINKVLRDAIEMELMFQSKLDSLNDKFELKQHSNSKAHTKSTFLSSDDKDEKKDT
jgi:ABC-type transporter Mla subunit MlaD